MLASCRSWQWCSTIRLSHWMTGQPNPRSVDQTQLLESMEEKTDLTCWLFEAPVLPFLFCFLFFRYANVVPSVMRNRGHRNNVCAFTFISSRHIYFLFSFHFFFLLNFRIYLSVLRWLCEELSKFKKVRTKSVHTRTRSDFWHSAMTGFSTLSD